MSDNLIEDIIQKSLSEQTASSPTAPLPKDPTPENPPRKRLNPLLISTILLSVALAAALLGLVSQQWKFQSQLAEITEEYEQELLVKDRWIELRTEEAEAYEFGQSVFIDAYNQSMRCVKGIISSETIFGLYERAAYEQAAAELINFTDCAYLVPADTVRTPAPGSGSGSSAIAGLLPLYRVDYQSRLEETARSLFAMGLIEQNYLDYIVSLQDSDMSIN